MSEQRNNPDFEYSLEELVSRHASGEISAAELQAILERREIVIEGRQASSAFGRKVTLVILIFVGIGLLSCGGCVTAMLLS